MTWPGSHGREDTEPGFDSEPGVPSPWACTQARESRVNGIDVSSGGQGFGLAWGIGQPAIPPVTADWGSCERLLRVRSL